MLRVAPQLPRRAHALLTSQQGHIRGWWQAVGGAGAVPCALYQATAREGRQRAGWELALEAQLLAGALELLIVAGHDGRVVPGDRASNPIPLGSVTVRAVSVRHTGRVPCSVEMGCSEHHAGQKAPPVLQMRILG